MCGIIFCQDFAGNPVNNLVFDQYVDQRTRGHEGFGVFDGKKNKLFHAAMEDRIVNWLGKKKNETDTLMFHHRFPTSTINVKKAAHPFATSSHFGDNEYVLVHNGVINNPNALKGEHEKLGIKYRSVLDDGKFNDSEALAWDFALTMEGKQDKLQAYGGIAFIAMKLVKGIPKQLYFGRNTRPLNMYRTKDFVMLSSEGEGELIKSDTLYTFNMELKRLTTRNFKVPSYNPSYVSENWDRQRWNAGSSYSRQQSLIPSRTTFGYDADGEFHYDENGYTDPCGNYYLYDDENESRASYPGAYMDVSGIANNRGVTERIGDFIKRNKAPRNFEDYEYDYALDMWVPKSNEKDSKALFKGALTEDEITDLLFDSAVGPTTERVQEMAQTYLTVVDGNFQDAIDLIETDLDMVFTMDLCQERVDNQILLETVEAYIERDHDYLNGEQIASEFKKKEVSNAIAN